MDCLLIYYRQKDDPFNAVAAGFITGGVLAIRGMALLILTLCRWCECGIQKRHGGRYHPSPDRRSVFSGHFHFNEEAVLNDGGNAESRDGKD